MLEIFVLVRGVKPLHTVPLNLLSPARDAFGTLPGAL